MTLIILGKLNVITVMERVGRGRVACTGGFSIAAQAGKLLNDDLALPFSWAV